MGCRIQVLISFSILSIPCLPNPLKIFTCMSVSFGYCSLGQWFLLPQPFAQSPLGRAGVRRKYRAAAF
jgi:hypothetical protein